jgi:hypothetical protein
VESSEAAGSEVLPFGESDGEGFFAGCLLLECRANKKLGAQALKRKALKNAKKNIR